MRVRKRCLHMSQTAELHTARDLARVLLQREARGPGDTENAMRRLEQRSGIDFGVWWSLRYRPPQDILSGVFSRLRAFYVAECERQMRLLAAEIENAKAANDLAPDDLHEIEAALAQARQLISRQGK
jgi:hypothetical protein